MRVYQCRSPINTITELTGEPPIDSKIFVREEN